MIRVLLLPDSIKIRISDLSLEVLAQVRFILEKKKYKHEWSENGLLSINSNCYEFLYDFTMIPSVQPVLM